MWVCPFSSHVKTNQMKEEVGAYLATQKFQGVWQVIMASLISSYNASWVFSTIDVSLLHFGKYMKRLTKYRWLLYWLDAP